MDILELLVKPSLILFFLWVLKENIAEIRKNTTNNLVVVKFLICIPLLFTVCIVLTIIVPLGRIYQIIAAVILKIKLGEEYCDIVKGSNNLMTADTWKHSLIKTLVIVQYNKTLAKKDFLTYTKEILERRRSEKKIHKKFFTTLYSFMGLLFYKNIKIDMSDILRPLPITKNLDKNGLMNLLKGCFYETLPLNGTALWDVYVGTQPINNWKENHNADIEYYPLLFRTHHVVADGTSLVKTFNLVFQGEEHWKNDSVSNFQPTKTTAQKILVDAHQRFKTCVMFLSSAYLFALHKGYDSNDLHGKPFKCEEVMQGGFDQDGVYFQKVKKIKKMCPEVSFPQILIAACSASLYEYYQKVSNILVEIILGSLPVWFSKKFGSHIENTIVGTFLPGPPTLKYSIGVYEISDCLFWTPHICQLGLGITTITYGNRLAIGVTSDSHVMEQSQVDEMRNTSSKWEIVKFTLCAPFLLIFFVSMFVVVIPLAKIFQLIVIAILKIKIGDEYCESIRGANLLMASDHWKHSLIKTLVVVEFNKTLAKKTFFDYTKEIFERRRSENKIHKKFLATTYSFMGYLFLKNVKVELSEILRPLPSTDNLDKNTINSVLKNCFYQPLYGPVLWDLYVGTQPIKNWKTNPNADIEYYPLFFRTHHLLADGINLTKTFTLLFQGREEVLKVDLVPKKSIVQFTTEKICVWFRTCVMFLSCAYLFLLHKGYDSNDLHFEPYKYEEVLQGNFDSNRIYFQKMKKIRTICPNVSFPQILLSAFAESLYEHFEKHCSKCPDYITTALPVVTDAIQVRKVLSGQIDSSDVCAKNEFTFLQLKLPIDVSKDKWFDVNAPMTSRVKIVGKALSILKNSIEPQFSHIFVEIILEPLPFWFMRKFSQNIHNTTVTTFLPGPPKLKYSSNVYEISDCLFWVPHPVQLGVGISTVTYDSHLAIGFNSDTQLKKQVYADEILNNVYKNIDLLEKEIESNFKES
ncbi:hypothetical protein FQR65_LT00856 [Abscondita terminalis]|nr:hypothetical protein FQR65_LT00856 [Abscondita terminalis]